MKQDVTRGAANWIDNRKSYGFILEESGQDGSCHDTPLDGDVVKTLNEGERVHYN